MVYYLNSSEDSLRLRLENIIEDKRGDMIFMSFGKIKVNFFQIKKDIAQEPAKGSTILFFREKLFVS